MGDEGTLDVSESGSGSVYRESWVEEEKWYPWEDEHLVKREAGLDQRLDTKSVLDVRSSAQAAQVQPAGGDEQAVPSAAPGELL